MNFDKLLEKGIELGASDVHIQAGSKPRLRIHGRMHSIDAPPLKSTEIEEFIHRIVGEKRWDDLQDKMLFDHKVFVRSGNYVSKSFGEKFIRISFSVPQAGAEKFASVFPEVMAQLRR